MSTHTVSISRRTALVVLALTAMIGAVFGGTMLMATTDLGARAHAGVVYSPPPWIDNTGTTDVSDVLSKWIQVSTADGTADDPAVIALTGTYRVEYGLNIGSNPHDLAHPSLTGYERHHIVLDLTNATLVQKDPTRFDNSVKPVVEPRKRWGVPMIKIMGGSDIEIRGGTLTSTNIQGRYSKSREPWAGITINGTDGVRLVGLHVFAVWGDFVYINHGSDGQRSSDVLIDGGVYDRNGRQGVTLNAVDGLEVRNVTFKNTQRMLFDHEPDSLGGATDVFIHDNTGNSGGLGYMNLAPLARTPLHNIVISHNHLWTGHFRITASGGAGGTRRSVFSLTDNTTDADSDYSGGYLARTPLVFVPGWWDGVTITGNHDHGAAKAVAVSVSPVATNVTVAPNEFIGFKNA